MAFGPVVEEQPSVAERAFRNPKKALIDLLRGSARGTATMPGDIYDLLSMGVPGMQPGKAGALSRELLDKTPLKATGAPLESAGEFISPPTKTAAKIGAGLGTAMMVPARRAIDAGFLNPQALIDALKMKSQGRKADEVWAQTGVEITKPGVLPGAQSHAMTAIETPGYRQPNMHPDPYGWPLAELLKRGDAAGLDDLIKLYPDLAKTKIKPVSSGPNNLGSYTPSRDTIAINTPVTARDPRFQGVLAHEAYHAGPERFDKLPPGSSPEAAGQAQGVGGMVLDRGARDTEAAFLARSLAEQRGLFDRGYGNAVDPMELAQLFMRDKSSKGSPALTNQALAAALKNDSTTLAERLEIITDLQGKIAPNPMHAYLTTWGERNARVSESQAGKSKEWLRQNPPSTIERIPEKALWDVREFKPEVWRKLGLL